MKQITLFVLTAALVGILAFGVVADVSAEEITPINPGNGRGNGRGGNSGGTGVPMEMNVNLDGAMDDFQAAYIADGLGISVEDLKAREAAGETLAEIGLSLGFDAQAVLDLHTDARIAALEQAEWMISRLGNRQGGFADGTCDGTEECEYAGQQSSQKNMRGNRNGGN